MNDPDSYDSFSRYQRRDAEDLIPYIVSQMSWSKEEKILDFGCGSGYNTRHVLFPAVRKSSNDGDLREIYAVDISRSMIEFAVTKYEHPEITYRVLDIDKDEMHDLEIQFDKIFSFHVVHWISDWNKLMTTMHRLLKTNGEIGFYFLSGGCIFSAYDAISKHPKWSAYATDVHKYIPKTFYSKDPGEYMRKLMTALGFHVQEATLVPRPFRYHSLEELMISAMAANPFYPRIPKNQKAEYKEDFLKAFTPFVRPCASVDDPLAVEITASVMLVRAKKL